METQEFTDQGMPLKTTLTSTFVAFLDILGFKKLVKNNSHSYLEEVYLNTLSGNITHALANGKYVLFSDNGQEYFTPDTREVSVNSLLVSDSIVIWTDNDSMEAFVDMVSAVRSLMAISAFEGIPLRGAITLGPITMHIGKIQSGKHNFQHTLFGKALVEAYSLEKKQQWSGCAIHDEAIKRFKSHYQEKSPLPESLLTLERMIIDKWICEYIVPLKKTDRCTRNSMYVIDWVNHPQTTTRMSTILRAFQKHNKMEETSNQDRNKDNVSIEEKINNTIAFVKHVNPSAEDDDMTAIYKRFLG